MQLTTNERETLLLNTWKKSTHQKDSMQREGGGENCSRICPTVIVIEC